MHADTTGNGLSTGEHSQETMIRREECEAHGLRVFDTTVTFAQPAVRQQVAVADLERQSHSAACWRTNSET